MIKRIYALFLCLVLIFTGSLACSEPSEEKVAKFTVSYIDVGEGDCVLLCFPDGKTMLIDCASDSDYTYSSIKAEFESKKVSKIDYFVLTHPDEQHIGNAIKIINEYSVEKMFIPYIMSPQVLPFFNQLLQVIEDKQIDYSYTQIGQSIVGTDYAVAILSPDELMSSTGAYFIFNSQLEPTKEQANDLSPIIFIECLKVRFLFCGDAGKDQENFVLRLYQSGYYNNVFDNINVNLSNLDFYMLSNGGDNYGNGYEFLSQVSPANAIISVGGNNSLAHPSSSVLATLFELAPNCNLYRTDVYGTISVEVYGNRDFQVVKSLNK